MAAGSVRTITYNCPSGKKVLSGGFSNTDSAVRVRASIADTSDTSWTFTIHNGALSAQSFSIGIICVSAL